MAGNPEHQVIKQFPTEKRLVRYIDENVNGAAIFLHEHEKRVRKETADTEKSSDDRMEINAAQRKRVALDALRDRMREALDVKKDIEQLVGDPSKADELREVAKGGLKTLRVLKNAFDNAVREILGDNNDEESHA